MITGIYLMLSRNEDDWRHEVSCAQLNFSLDQSSRYMPTVRGSDTDCSLSHWVLVIIIGRIGLGGYHWFLHKRVARYV